MPLTLIEVIIIINNVDSTLSSSDLCHHDSHPDRGHHRQQLEKIFEFQLSLLETGERFVIKQVFESLCKIF